MRIGMKRALLLVPMALASLVALAYVAGVFVFKWNPRMIAPAAPAREWRAPMRTWPEHDAVMRALPSPRLYVLRFEGARGGLLYFGAKHSLDPAHPQFARIRQQWKEFRPTVALVESRVGYLGLWGYERATRAGEPAATMFLADEDDVPVFSLEPDRTVEVAALLRRFSPPQVAMMLTLSTYYGDKRSRPVGDQEVEGLLHKRTQIRGLEGALAGVAEMDALWRKEIPGLPDWRELKDSPWSPNANRTFLDDMARVRNDARDEHWMRVIVELIGRGERVFVTCGASHVIRQEPVLRAELRDLGLSLVP